MSNILKAVFPWMVFRCQAANMANGRFFHARLVFTASRLAIVKEPRPGCVTWLEQYESCLAYFSPLNLSLHHKRLDLFGILLKKKKSASVRVCQMFFFFFCSAQLPSVSLADKHTDHSWTFSGKSLHQTKAKSDVICIVAKIGRKQTGLILSLVTDCNLLKLHWKPNPKDQSFYSAKWLNQHFLCLLHTVLIQF